GGWRRTPRPEREERADRADGGGLGPAPARSRPLRRAAARHASSARRDAGTTGPLAAQARPPHRAACRERRVDRAGARGPRRRPTLSGALPVAAPDTICVVMLSALGDA